MKIKDLRIKITNETLQSMKIVKVSSLSRLRVQRFMLTCSLARALQLYAWEKSFGQRIEDIRNDERVLLWRYLALSILMNILWRMVPVIVGLTTFAVFVSTGDFTHCSLVHSLLISLRAACCVLD